MRVMMRMLTTTYGESVSSTPMCAICEPSGPMLYGITYIVRPRMQPSKSLPSFARISAGSTQLLLGPASSFVALQTKVRSSMRATSSGSERARKQPGRFASFSLTSMPDSTISWFRRSYSSCEPSHQWIRAGLVSCAISATQLFSFSFVTYAGAARAGADMGRGGGLIHKAFLYAAVQ